MPVPFPRLQRGAACAVVSLAAAGAPLARAPLLAQPTRVTFAEYTSPATREYPATFGAPLTAGGFDFYEAFGTDGYGTGSRNALGTWGTADDGRYNRPSNLGASNAVYATTFGVSILMDVAGDDPFQRRRTFNLYSIDVGNLFSSYALPPAVTGGPLGFSLTFFGYVPADDAFVTQTFAIPTPPTVGGVVTPVLGTLAFDARWRGLGDVYWYQNDAYYNYQHQFTNVVAEVTPEPAAGVLLGVGLAGALVIARRRRPA